MKLVIVESPSKAKTIKYYLGKEYWVLASNGHIRDLALTGREKLGVDVKNHFQATYEISSDKKGIVEYLKKASKTADEVILATDPDREGEAISWHIAETLQLDIATTQRYEFHEITKRGIEEARNNPRFIDMKLVESQETRRILDRIIGFKLSQLLQSKINSKSAGRVQSVALSILVEREEEIAAFIPVVTYTPTADFTVDKVKFSAHLVAKTEKDAAVSYEKIKLESLQQADDLIASLSKDFILNDISKERKDYYSKPPHTTSTLQQDAYNFYHFTSKKTNRIAQKLYEGIDIGSETTGLITYMRTDSVRLSPVFIFPTKDFIKQEYGEEYVGFVKSQKNTDNVQNAHEAIRPTDVHRTPESLKKYLSEDEYKLYRLIWCRAVGSLMKAQEVEISKAVFNNNEHSFLATGTQSVFDGYLKVWADFEKNKLTDLPQLEVLKSYKASKVESKKDETSPPSRYTEARLIKAMEELGIGRPSTYSSTIETLKLREYINVNKGFFVPTPQGTLTHQKLKEFFIDFINVEYTALMEKDLDEIAEGKNNKEKILSAFYDQFNELISIAWDKMEKIEKEKQEVEILETKCPECGNNLVKRKSKYGQVFTGCSNFPKCKYIEKKEEDEKFVKVTCPKCQKGHLVDRRGRYGSFWGCSNYPKCDYVSKK